MLVREFLKNITGEVTFIKARARKDAHTPFYHDEYQTTPIRRVEEWDGKILDYIILNDAQTPIDWLSGAPWKVAFDRGDLTSLLVIDPEDLALLYPGKEQRDHMIKYIDEKITKRGDITNSLKRIRTDRGFTQNQLAELSGVNLRVLQYYEQGYKDINKASAITVFKIAQALGCTVEDILKTNKKEVEE